MVTFQSAETIGECLERLRAAYAAGLNWIPATFSAVGRLELLRWMREQAVATTRHRYGNLIR